jgi:hypothetical protein
MSQTYSVVKKSYKPESESDSDSNSENYSDSESQSESESTNESKAVVPKILEEPIDPEVSRRKKKDYPNINLNVPKDKEVLLETKSPVEFEEPERQLEQFDKAINEFAFFNNSDKSKKSKKSNKSNKSDKSDIFTNLVYWQKKVFQKLGNCKSTHSHIIIPIILVNNITEIYNFSKFKSFISLLKEVNKLSTVVCSGNIFDNSIFTNTSLYGSHCIDLLNQCNVDILNLSEYDLKLELSKLKERISEFNNEIISSNICEFDSKTKLNKTTGYLIRKFGSNGQLSVLFISLNNNTNLELYCNTDYINLTSEILKTHKGKFNYVICISSLDHSTNKKILESLSDINLILGTGSDNSIFDYKGRKIVNSDSNLNSVYVNILKYDKKNNTIECDSINYNLDKKIKNDSNISKICKYYYDLAFKELKMLYHIDPEEVICINSNIENESFILDKIFTYIKSYNLPIDYIVYDFLISKNYVNNNKYIIGYDIYKMCVLDSDIISIEIDSDILNNIHKNPNLKIYHNFNKIKNESEIIIITTERILNDYISYYFSDSKTVKIYGSLRKFIYNSYKEITI